MLSLLLILLLSLSAIGAYVDLPYYPLASIKNPVSASANPSVVIKSGADPSKTLCDAEVKKLVYNVLDLARFDQLLTPDIKTVLLKPNIVEPLESGSGVITDYRVVENIASYIYEKNPSLKIIVGEGAGGWVPAGYEWGAFPGAKASDGFEIAGYRNMVLKLKKSYPKIDIEIVDLNIPLEDLVEVKPKKPLSEDIYYIHRLVHDCDLYVSVPVLKIIETCQVTLSIKNNVGLAAGAVYGWSKNRGFPYTKNQGGLRHTYPVIDEEIVDLTQVRVPDFVIIDGIVGMEKDKTNFRRGVKKQANLIIAGKDPVAVDAAACLLMGLNPRDIEHIALAYYLGLGSIYPTICGDSLESLSSKWIKPDPKYSPRGHFGQGVRIFEVSADDQIFSEPLLFMDTLINPWVLGNASKYTLRTWFSLAEDLDLEMWVGSDNNLSISLDDKPIYLHQGKRKHALPNDIVPISVSTGSHELTITLPKKGIFSLTMAEVLPKNLKNRSFYTGTTPLQLIWRWED